MTISSDSLGNDGTRWYMAYASYDGAVGGQRQWLALLECCFITSSTHGYDSMYHDPAPRSLNFPVTVISHGLHVILSEVRTQSWPDLALPPLFLVACTSLRIGRWWVRPIGSCVVSRVRRQDLTHDCPSTFAIRGLRRPTGSVIASFRNSPFASCDIEAVDCPVEHLKSD